MYGNIRQSDCLPYAVWIMLEAYPAFATLFHMVQKIVLLLLSKTQSKFLNEVMKQR